MGNAADTYFHEIMLFFFVVWQGIYDPRQTQEKDGTEALLFYHPSLLCCRDQMLEVTELSQHLVMSSKTVRPIISRCARCMGHVKITWSAVFSLAPHSHFTEEERPHLCMDEPKRPCQVRPLGSADAQLR